MNPFYQREFIFRYGYSWIEWDSTQKLQPKPTKNQNNIWFAYVKEMRRPCLMQCAFVHTETSEQRGKYHVMHSNKNISQHIKSKQYLTHSKSECSMVTLWSFQFIHLVFSIDSFGNWVCLFVSVPLLSMFRCILLFSVLSVCFLFVFLFEWFVYRRRVAFPFIHKKKTRENTTKLRIQMTNKRWT